jgi:hypothetical protein
VISPSQGKQIYETANEPRLFYSLPGHGHNDLCYDFAPIGMVWVSRLKVKEQAAVH